MNITQNGIKAYRSKLGHNNFHYPSIEDVVFIKPGSEYKRLAWVGSSMTAININSKNILNEDSNENIVVWVEKDKLRTI